MKRISSVFIILLLASACTLPKRSFKSSEVIKYDSYSEEGTDKTYMKSEHNRIAIHKSYIKINKEVYPIHQVKKYAWVDDAWAFYSDDYIFIYKESLKLDKCDLRRNVLQSYPLTIRIDGHYR